MDRNSIVGIILIGLILVGYSYLTRPSEEEIKKAREQALRKRDSLERIDEARKRTAIPVAQKDTLVLADTLVVDDSLVVAQHEAKFGAFSEAAAGEREYYTLENNKIKVTISNKGGRVYSVMLKEYKRYDSTQVVLFDGDTTIFGFTFPTVQNKIINTNDLYFVPQTTDKNLVIKDKSQSFSLRLKAGENKYIEYVYTLQPDSFILDYKINLVGMNEVLAANQNYLDLHWQFDMPRQEKGVQWENDNSTIYYKNLQAEVENLAETKDKTDQRIPTSLKWIAYKQQFFSSVLIANQSFESAILDYTKYKEGQKEAKNYLKNLNAQITIPLTFKAEESIGLSFYFGPNKYSILSNVRKSENLELQELIPLGWAIFRWVNRFAIIPLFNLLGSFFTNYGLIILILTIIIKIVLFPLTYKSYLSSAKMRVLKPQIDEINKKFPADKAMDRQQAMMAFYRKAGVNPMGGCLPVVLQMPILIAMFRFFPASIELRQKGFLWAEDLSTYDSILNLPFTIPWYGDHISLFCLLMAASMVLTTKISSAQMDTGSSQMPGMKTMMYLMPVMMLVWFNNYSSGLSYYYLLTNVISYAQTIVMRRFVDDKKLLARLEENKKKPTKKSRFQSKLEEVAKQKGYKLPK